VSETPEPDHQHHHDDLHVKVVPTGSVTPTPFTFEKTMLVSLAAKEAADRLKYRAKVVARQLDGSTPPPG